MTKRNLDLNVYIKLARADSTTTFKMAACRRRVLFLFLSILLVIYTSFVNTATGNEASETIARSKRAAVDPYQKRVAEAYNDKPYNVNNVNPPGHDHDDENDEVKVPKEAFKSGSVRGNNDDQNVLGRGGADRPGPNVPSNFGQGGAVRPGPNVPSNFGQGGAVRPGPNVPINLGRDRVQDPTNKVSKKKISATPECAEDVQKFCSKGVKDNNFAILDCLQNDERTNDDVSDDCQHFLWQYKHDLTKDDRFDIASKEVCAQDLQNIKECNGLQQGEGLIIPCLIENLNNITDKSCQSFLNKMASIIFSDYRLIYRFAETCRSDIEKYDCGRLHPANSDAPHSQGKTVECLAVQMQDLTPNCKKQVLRVYELQSDDFHLDRPLYYACVHDREHFCAEVKAGNGAVFQCLFDHLSNPDLSGECREKLELRQLLMAQDVRVEYRFFRTCEKDIATHHCLAGPDGHEDVKRAHILMCLEGAHMDDKLVSGACIQEMIKVRQRLIEDYRINPDLMARCSSEIDKTCKGPESGGATLHCLMKLARDRKNKDSIRPECRAELQLFLKETNILEDYRLDKPLQLACAGVVTALCSHVPPGPGSIINCLLDNIDEKGMSKPCEEHLLEIQYFIARDFRLDPELYKSCKRDAKKYCHEPDDWLKSEAGPDQGPRVLSCLHRLHRHQAKDSSTSQLSRPCAFAVQRVIRQRALSVDLHPDIEQACIIDLGKLCSEGDDDTDKGAEIECLQTNYEKLSPACKEAIGNFTEEEFEDIQMDHILLKACTPMIKQFCSDELDEEADSDSILECLIENKNHGNMDGKCAVGIEHHQLISLKDFRFNHKFKEACHKSVQSLCKNKVTKFDVVSCLSEHVRNDTLLDKKHRVEQACRRQLKVELLQRGENINLDPELRQACDLDITSLCANVKPGNAMVLECLKKNQPKLTSTCHKLLFKREKDEFAIADYALVHSCKKMIKKYCENAEEEPEILDCLKREKDRDGFEERCRRVVQQRQIAQARDYRLNPLLQKGCQQDIPKFCGQILSSEENDAELEGKVIDCLKKQFAIKRLSVSCEHQIRERVKDAAVDINLSPVLLKACKDDIPVLCKEDLLAETGQGRDTGVESMNVQEAGRGGIVECLKARFSERLLKSHECIKEVASLLAESHVDVNVDPLLQTACQEDLADLCKEVRRGQGRQMSCLLSFLEEDPNKMTNKCRMMLKRRKEMWEYAAQVAPPENFGEIYDQVMTSPSKNYFLAVLFTVVGIIFIVGISCGRVTKRVRAEMKNK